MARQTRKPSISATQVIENSAARVVSACDVEAEDVLEIGQAVIAAETEIVAEEAEHQRIGQRLGDDRQIDAGDAAAKRQPAEHESERARHQHDHQRAHRQNAGSHTRRTAVPSNSGTP